MSGKWSAESTEFLVRRQTLASAIETGSAVDVNAVLNEIREEERLRVLNSNEKFDSSVSRVKGLYLSYWS